MFSPTINAHAIILISSQHKKHTIDTVQHVRHFESDIYIFVLSKKDLKSYELLHICTWHNNRNYHLIRFDQDCIMREWCGLHLQTISENDLEDFVGSKQTNGQTKNIRNEWCSYFDIYNYQLDTFNLVFCKSIVYKRHKLFDEY